MLCLAENLVFHKAQQIPVCAQVYLLTYLFHPVCVTLCVHRFSYSLCCSYIFSSELPLSLCKGSSVIPNLLNNKVEQIVSKLEQVLLSDSYLTWFHPSSKSLPSHGTSDAAEQKTNWLGRAVTRSRPPVCGSARTRKRSQTRSVGNCSNC